MYFLKVLTAGALALRATSFAQLHGGIVLAQRGQLASSSTSHTTTQLDTTIALSPCTLTFTSGRPTSQIHGQKTCAFTTIIDPSTVSVSTNTPTTTSGQHTTASIRPALTPSIRPQTTQSTPSSTSSPSQSSPPGSIVPKPPPPPPATHLSSSTKLSTAVVTTSTSSSSHTSTSTSSQFNSPIPNGPPPPSQPTKTSRSIQEPQPSIPSATPSSTSTGIGGIIGCLGGFAPCSSGPAPGSTSIGVQIPTTGLSPPTSRIAFQQASTALFTNGSQSIATDDSIAVPFTTSTQPTSSPGISTTSPVTQISPAPPSPSSNPPSVSSSSSSQSNAPVPPPAPGNPPPGTGIPVPPPAPSNPPPATGIPVPPPVSSSTQGVSASAGGSISQSPGTRAVITIGSSTITANSASDFVIGSATLTPGGQVTVGGTTFSLASNGVTIVIGTSTEVLFPTAATAQSSITTAPPIIIGSLTISAGSSSDFVIGSQTLTPGSVATISGEVISINTGGAIVVNGVTETGSPGPARSTSASAVVVVGGSSITANSASAFVIGGQTLFPGSAITVGGDVITLPFPSSSGPITAAASITSAPIFVVGSATLMENAQSDLVIGTETLTPGGALTVDGQVISLSPTGNAVIVNGGDPSTFITEKSSINPPPVTSVIIAGQTLTSGGRVTVGGDIISLAPSGTGIIVIGTVTIGGGEKTAIATATATATGKKKNAAGRMESSCVIVLCQVSFVLMVFGLH